MPRHKADTVYNCHYLKSLQLFGRKEEGRKWPSGSRLFPKAASGLKQQPAYSCAKNLAIAPRGSVSELANAAETRRNTKCRSNGGTAAAAAKSLLSCPTLWDAIDGSPPGSPVPGILQARTLEWVAISFSNAWKWKVKVKSLSCVRILVTLWTAAYQVPLSMGSPRQEYWSGLPLPFPNGRTRKPQICTPNSAPPISEQVSSMAAKTISWDDHT